MNEKIKWREELIDTKKSDPILKEYCENILDKLNISDRDRPIAQYICENINQKTQQLPSAEKVLEMLKNSKKYKEPSSMSKIIMENKSNELNSKMTEKMKGDDFESPIKSLITLLIKNPKVLENPKDRLDEIILKDVFFDSGGNLPEMSSGLCKFLKLEKREDEKRWAYREIGGEPFEDFAYLARGDICIDTVDIHNKKLRKCANDYRIKCLTNLDKDRSLAGTIFKTKSYNRDGSIKKEGLYDATIGEQFYRLLIEEKIEPDKTERSPEQEKEAKKEAERIDEEKALYDINRTKEPLVMIFYILLPEKKRPLIIPQKDLVELRKEFFERRGKILSERREEE